MVGMRWCVNESRWDEETRQKVERAVADRDADWRETTGRSNAVLVAIATTVLANTSIYIYLWCFILALSFNFTV